MITLTNSQDDLTALHCVEHFPSNEHFVEVNSSQGLLPYIALLKTYIYYNRTINKCLIIYHFKALSSVFFKKTYGVHVNEKELSFLVKCLVQN